MVAVSRSLTALAIVLVCLNPVVAAPAATGWLSVRVLDSVNRTHCIDRSKESVTIRLTRIVVDRQAVWFAEDKKVDILLNVTMSGRTAIGPKFVTLPRAYPSTFKSAPGGMLTLDSELAPIGRYKLADSDKVSSIRLEMFLSNEIGNATLSDVVLGIADVSKTVPLPPNALTKVTDMIGSGIMKRIAEDPALADNLARQVTLRFNFSPTGTSDPSNVNVCKGMYESTGTRAIIKEAKGTESEGIIDINKFYCYRVVALPTYKLQFAPPKPDGTCDMSGTAWNDLNNPLVAYFVNGDAPNAISGQQLIATMAESYARCRANGVRTARCFRAN